MRFARPFFATALVLLVCDCGLDGAESTYQYNAKGFAEQIAAADGALEAELEATQAKLEAEYAALPKEEGPRLTALEALNDRYRQAKWDAEEKVEAAAGKKAEADKAKIAEYQKTFVGVWKGVGMDLTITADGSLAYKRTKGGGNTEVNAPITEFRKDAFDAGVMGITTTFQINQPPHPADGKTKMTIDGVELTRMDL